MLLKLRKALLFLCLFQAFTASAQESMIPDISYSYLEKLIAVAKTNYPRVHMYEHKVLQAKSGIKKAQVGWFNLLNFNYLYSPNNSTTALVNPSLLDGYQFGVYFNLGSVLVNGPTIRMAREDYNVALDNQAEYNLTLEAEVTKRYFDYIKEIKLLTLRTHNAEDIENSSQQVKYKFQKGEETFDNYNKGLTLYANAVQLKIEAEEEVLVAKSALEELLVEKLDEVE